VADADIKRAVANIPVPTFEETSFVRLSKPLSECTVAIVTTAGLRLPEQDGFAGRDTSYRELPGDRRDLTMGHWSQNFDRSGFMTDINVVYPVDRLHELAAAGVIGAVAPRHFAFVGNQDETMTALRIDSGPAVGELLRHDGVDVVLLTPV
jgi:D-proline reductase (dithiol) PrdB